MIDIKINKARFRTLFKKIKRKGALELFKWLEYETNFFESPASSKYHLSEPGGLVEHKLSVYDALHHLNTWLKLGLTEVEMIVIALLHDICKVDIYKFKSGSYSRNDQDPIGHGEKSVIIIQKFMKLTDKEIALIRWHMGPYDEQFIRGQNYILKKYPLAKAIYFADDISSTYMENK